MSAFTVSLNGLGLLLVAAVAAFIVTAYRKGWI